MGALASTDVTVTIEFKDRTMRRRRNEVKLVFGDGIKTYPTNGVPLPAKKAFGLHTVIGRVDIQQPINGYVYKYDPTNHTIRIYQSAGFTPAGTVAAPTFTGESYTPAGTNSAPAFTGSALSAHAHDLKVIGGAAGGIDEPVGVEGTDTLAKDAATDRTILGADSATKGGVIAAGAGTPAGTVAAPIFTGAAHTLAGTNSAPAFTGVAVAAAALVEVTTAFTPAATTLWATFIGA